MNSLPRASAQGGTQLARNATVESEDTGKPVLVAEWLTRILAG